MGFDSIKVRPITKDEVLELTPDDLIYMDTKDYTGPVLEEAHLVKDRSYYIEQGKLQVRTIYGVETWRAFEDVYLPDENGTAMDIHRTAGTRMSTTLFFPGIDQGEAQDRLYKALRAEFGAGTVELWNERSGPVADTLRDVVEVRTEMVVTGSGKNKQTHWRDAEKHVIASGVYAAQTQHFMGRQRPGWSLRIEAHIPRDQSTFTI